MLKRKIETYLANWKQTEDRKPLVIKGIRQCGKTYIVQKFARENYESVVYMNFILEADKKSAFTGNIDVDTIILICTHWILRNFYGQTESVRWLLILSSHALRTKKLFQMGFTRQ